MAKTEVKVFEYVVLVESEEGDDAVIIAEGKIVGTDADGLGNQLLVDNAAKINGIGKDAAKRTKVLVRPFG